MKILAARKPISDNEGYHYPHRDEDLWFFGMKMRQSYNLENIKVFCRQCSCTGSWTCLEDITALSLLNLWKSFISEPFMCNKTSTIVIRYICLKLIMLWLKNWPDSLLLNVHDNTSDTEFWYFYRTELLWHYYSCAAGDNDFWLLFMRFMPIFIPTEDDGKTRKSCWLLQKQRLVTERHGCWILVLLCVCMCACVLKMREA